ncbi:MAG: flavodoxin family protein [Defluviitaleaceae bacterium]|nr:flavodoxin family protein [Defluviitaleaceae bacterium]
MKTIVINGSPRGEGSNTMNLTQAFLEGAKLTDVEIIDISQVTVKGCKGCFSCWTATPGECVIKDDMTDILPKMIAADVVVWSFPLYSCGFPGEMKCFIDRRLPIALPYMDAESETGNHPSRHDLSHQKHFYISTCGFWTAKGNYDSIIKVLEHGGKQKHEDFSILCGQGELFNVPDPGLKELTNAYLDTVRRAGAEWISGKITTETRAALSEPIFPKDVYEGFANASWDE